MFFSIDPNGGVPIYEQIVRQVKFAVAESTLGPGQLLPSVRTLSQQLTINPNTIARAYQQLQIDGVLESMRGRGLVVCAGARQRCIAARRHLITERLRGVLTEALHAGYTVSDIQAAVEQQLSELEGRVATVATDPSEAAEGAAEDKDVGFIR